MNTPLIRFAWLALTLAPLAAPATASGSERREHGIRSVAELRVAPRRECVPTPRFQPPRVWIPGHYETRIERIWVPGELHREWVAASFEWRVDVCGRRVFVQTRPGFWRTTTGPSRLEQREVRIWVAGHWMSQAC
ncbi:MAG: hypothetical protein IT454_06930 [Planctomycetes bacterium]|nr:hypothetical protein [Planctomycetota bacterium]